MFVTWYVALGNYLMFLSLNFLIIEMAVRMQRAWYVGLELGAAWP